MSWEALKNNYKGEGIFLALGSGISLKSKIPTWQALLQRVSQYCLNRDDKGLFHDLVDYKFSYPAIASFFEENSNNREDFIEKVREALYQDFPFRTEGVNKSNRRKFVQYINKENPTLRAIGSLCAVKEKNKNTYKTNDRIHAVVTFNLDSLLQTYVYAKYEKILLHTIERSSASRISGKINIYHMHGYLRFDSKAGDPSKEASDSCILTEQDYFDFFNEPTSLFSYTFLYLLREYSCLFIGLSMQDDNIRRLLHYSKKERLSGYMKQGKVKNIRNKLQRHFAVIRKNENQSLNKAIEVTLKPLGVTVLWVDDYNEIPKHLESLYYSGLDNWKEVY